MKFIPEVIAALQTLKKAAVNDFERHRIAVLEKDLTQPPTVEIIDDNHQKFNGEIYGLVGDGHFRHQCSIHRAVFSYYFGDIPDNFVIHHIDENKSNNDISNLQLLSQVEHRKIHRPKGYKMACHSNIKIFVCRVCGKNFSSMNNGRNCYCSEKCRLKGNYKHRQKEFICEQCGQKFLSARNNVRFCSPKCRNEYRYHKS